ncbi:hypothetical protein GIB67_010347 [Kingdonia uniflora]|uniref:Retrotransposon gag domain-containing protein n=1 Tax=Kingdonia uniflora TaxID=39325 RepID=A0A7J7MA54_9MAGN|nr:hypothetical protein GIB67_010347 [Kingdonia uniflora]
MAPPIHPSQMTPTQAGITTSVPPPVQPPLPSVFQGYPPYSAGTQPPLGNVFRHGLGEKYTDVDDDGVRSERETTSGGQYTPHFERQQLFKGQGRDRGLNPPVDTPPHDLLEFDGKSDVDAFIDWLDIVVKIFTYKCYGDPKQVMIIESRLSGYALTWWNNVQQSRRSHGYPMITEWSKMRRDMKKKFIPMNYDQVVFEIVQLAKRASELQITENRPTASTTAVPTSSTNTAPHIYVTGNYYGYGKPGHQKRDCPQFAKRVGLVVDGVRGHMVATVQEVLTEDDGDDDSDRPTWIARASSGAPTRFRGRNLPKTKGFDVRLMCSYCKKHEETEVPDPYYGGPQGFEKVLDILEDACESLLDSIVAENSQIAESS